MKRILVTGALGQIGTELVMKLREVYGAHNVVASNISRHEDNKAVHSGPFEILDVRDYNRLVEICKQYEIDTVMNLAALLSATGEKNPQLLWQVNMDGLYNVLEAARELNMSVFTPSSIAAFGPDTPKVNTPQDTIQRPSTIYGVSKVAGELLCDYYFNKFGVDTRGVRYPGLISHGSLPGGGTTDYAVHIYYEAIKNKKYTSYIAAGTKMDMMYMPDAIDAIIQLMEADGSKLIHRNAFNITAMSFDPEILKDSIKKYIPEFEMDYNVDPIRQKIAQSWPDSLDDSAARKEWGWNPKFDLDSMTRDMIENLKIKLEVK
jgi:nucleoside-diphosphate-sugar epimerase